MSDCIFCAIVEGRAPSVTVREDETTVAFMDIHPATPGHVLVVPRRHSRDLLDIPAADLAAVTVAAQRVARAASAAWAAVGINLLNCCGADAWQTVFHFHMHVIPRYRDPARDGLELPWTPDVPGDPEELIALGATLADRLA